MPSELPSVEVKPTREFRRDLRTLAKKYRHIRSDVQALIERLQAGELLGDPLPGFEYSVYKVRVKNSDIQKGKSAGYRIVYYLQTPTIIFLMTIYSKSEQADIPADRIRQILNEVDEAFSDEGETDN